LWASPPEHWQPRNTALRLFAVEGTY
jgi:hypothetical protein